MLIAFTNQEHQRVQHAHTDYMLIKQLRSYTFGQWISYHSFSTDMLNNNHHALIKSLTTLCFGQLILLLFYKRTSLKHCHSMSLWDLKWNQQCLAPKENCLTRQHELWPHNKTQTLLARQKNLLWYA